MSKKPGWVRDAVATTVGWVNPRTNEVLSITTGLDDALPFFRGKIVWPKEDLKDTEDVQEAETLAGETEVVTEENVVEESISSLAVPEQSEDGKVTEVVKRPGRPRKSK